MKDHYDICVAGFWYGSNYGSLLNGYAEYCILKREFGKEVLMLQKPGASITDEEIHKGHNTRFVNKYYDPEDVSPALAYSELETLNDICDCFCAGSDQIWNYNLSFHENLYLPFVHDDKKLISFATSFGHKKDKTPDAAHERIKSYLQRYSTIAVREQFDVDILRDNYAIDGKLVFEPVFCVDKKYYTELAGTASFHEEEPYLLTYILDPTPEKRAAVVYYAEKLGIKTINILDGNPKNLKRNLEVLNLPNTIYDVGAEDFLKAFMNASYVITDSFHGSAFSIIFNKPFFAIGNYGRGFERFIDLLGRLKLIDRLVTDPKKIPHDMKYLAPIDYTATNAIIESEAKRTVEWFRYALDTPKEEMPKIVFSEKCVEITVPMETCAGCSACVNACPKGAVSLKPDVYGYYRRRVDPNKCVSCGLCSRVCPAINLPANKNTDAPDCYEFVSGDEAVLRRSSSGGLFTTMARAILARGGAVAGAAWTADMTVEHIVVESEADLWKLQKSKYLQSYMGSCMKQVKAILDTGRPVLFVGTPCQVAGLRGYLRKDYEALIAVDIFCSNAPSAGFFKKYLEEAFPQGVREYEFRYKKPEWNWDCVTVRIKDADGVETVRQGTAQDAFQSVFHNHVMCAPHCEKCRYQKVPRFGDLSMGDFWGIGKKDPDLRTQRGVSVVLANNVRGQAFLDYLELPEGTVMKQAPLEWIGKNGWAINGATNFVSPRRNAFYEAIQRLPFSEAVSAALNNGQPQPKPQPAAPRKAPEPAPAPLPEGNPSLLFNNRFSHFAFSPEVWEEHMVDGTLTLTVRAGQSGPGKLARLPLYRALKKGARYTLDVRFKTRTDSNYINFHVRNGVTGAYQIAFTVNPKPEDMGKWQDLSIAFRPDADGYDEFMLGASQIKGDDAYIAFDHIYIAEG